MLIAAVLRSAVDGNDERRVHRRHNIRLDACVDFDGQPIPFPCVIVDVMRGGPSTGIPAKSEQSDIRIPEYNYETWTLTVWASTAAALCPP